LRVERNGDRVRLISRNGYDWNQGEEPKAPRDAAGYGSIRMITEARNSDG